MIANYDRQIRDIIRATGAVLRNNGLPPVFKSWTFTQERGLAVLFGVLDDDRLTAQASRAGDRLKLRAYHHPDILHDLSTLQDGQVTVVPCNSSGMGYGFVLNAEAFTRLPEMAALPDSLPADSLPLGVGIGGAPILAHPSRLLNAMVAGGQGSGKSTFLRALAWAARRHGWQLWLADAEGHTFSPEAWSPLAAGPVAVTAGEMDALLDSVNAELDRRAELFRRAGELPPEDLDAYNGLAVRAGLTLLPYSLLLVDEANSYFDVRGMDQRIADLARRGRKWGLMLVLAAHSWRSQDVSRTLSALLPTRVCFRVADDTSGAVVLNSRAWGRRAMGLSRPGRGLLVMAGRRQPFQAYHLPDERLREILGAARTGQPPSPLSDLEIELVRHAVAELGGRFIVNKLAAAMQGRASHHTIRTLAQAWERRGWLTAPADATDSRQVTAQLREFAGLERTGVQGV